MLNNVEIEKTSQFFFIANMNEPQLYILHIGDYEDKKLFDYISLYDTQQPIISFITMTKYLNNENSLIIGCFSIHTESMQLLYTSDNNCYSKNQINIELEKYNLIKNNIKNDIILKYNDKSIENKENNDKVNIENKENNDKINIENNDKINIENKNNDKINIENKNGKKINFKKKINSHQ
jgi:hypothetical protein